MSHHDLINYDLIAAFGEAVMRYGEAIAFQTDDMTERSDLLVRLYREALGSDT